MKASPERRAGVVIEIKRGAPAPRAAIACEYRATMPAVASTAERGDPRIGLPENTMDDNAKKTALRMIPYGLYILTTANDDGEVAAATINWVTQSAFKPPQVVMGVKADSGAHELIKQSGHFALNVLGKDQQGLAFAFFKPAERDGHTVNGEPFELKTSGSPILESAVAYVECKLVHTWESGDHSVFVGEVIDAGVRHSPDGRPDAVTLTLEDLGEKVFYGG